MKLGVAIMCKDEGHIIERCISSVLDLADEVIITDTGSTDDTIIRAALLLQSHGIPYKIFKEEFKDFGHNRTLLLQRAARSKIDYVLMLDADEIIKKHYGLPELNLSHYNIRMLSGNSFYYLPRITSIQFDWEYIGVTHEFLETQGRVAGTTHEISIEQFNDGSRRQNNRKYTEDIELLTKAIAETSSDALKTRYTFYLAQSYYAANQFEKAIDQYLKRTFMGGWKEEIFYSFYQLGNIYSKTTNVTQVLKYYLLAKETCPWRAEPVHALNKFLVEHDYMTPHNDIFKTDYALPKDGLFIESDKYANATVWQPV